MMEMLHMMMVHIRMELLASIHNHADNILIVGIGEIQAVLNGVEFQTRHNDYNLNMPSTTSDDMVQQNRYHILLYLKKY